MAHIAFCTFDEVFRPQILITMSLPHIPFVIAGLDPAIHAAAPRPRQAGMDPRVKPAGDE
jgi:hypothetical protein